MAIINNYEIILGTLKEARDSNESELVYLTHQRSLPERLRISQATNHELDDMIESLEINHTHYEDAIQELESSFKGPDDE